MYCVCAEVDGAARTYKIVDPDTALRCKVPDAGICVGAVVLGVVGRPTEGRVLVICPEQAACSLTPVGEVPGARKVPPKNDRSNRNTGESAAHGIKRGALWRSARRIGAERALERWCVGLPKGKNLTCVFKVAAKHAVTGHIEQDFSSMHARHHELEIVAVLRDAEAALNDRAYFKRSWGVSLHGIGIAADGRLAVREWKTGEYEDKEPNGSGSDASCCLGHSISPSGLAEQGRR
jgi:hypothetical protein